MIGFQTDDADKKDTLRKMAALNQQIDDIPAALQCLTEVLALEQDPDAQAILLTKIAGNQKRQKNSEEAIAAAKQAITLLTSSRGLADIQTAKSKINLASILIHFEKIEDAKLVLQ